MQINSSCIAVWRIEFFLVGIIEETSHAQKATHISSLERFSALSGGNVQGLVFDDSTRTKAVRQLDVASAAGAYSAVASSLHRCCCSSTGITCLKVTDTPHHHSSLVSSKSKVLKLFSGTHTDATAPRVKPKTLENTLS
jgi:hypothetical protein